MKVHTRQVGEIMVAELTGEIDTIDSEGFADSLAVIMLQKPKAVVLDFSQVSYIASMGVSILVKLARDARAARTAVIIANVSDMVMTVLDTVHMGSIIPIESSVDKALSRLGAKAAASHA